MANPALPAGCRLPVRRGPLEPLHPPEGCLPAWMGAICTAAAGLPVRASTFAPSKPLPATAKPFPAAAKPLSSPSEPIPTAAKPLPTASFPLASAAQPLPTPAQPLAPTSFPLASASSSPSAQLPGKQPATCLGPRPAVLPALPLHLA